jgi:phosphatidylglycerol:prolipoprotein diacylglycerol transferase
MHSTLFYIPDVIPGTGIPVFGVGALLGAWLIAAIVWAVAMWRGGRVAELKSGAFLVLLIGGAIWFSGSMIEPGRGLAIRGYGTMLLIAVTSSVGLAIYRARQMRLDPELIYSLAFYLFVGGMVGARLFYVIEYRDQFFQGNLLDTLAAVFKFNEGGLVVYGSLIGGAVAWLVFCRKFQLPSLAIADLIAPSCALGAGLGRLGCLMQGCCYGGPCDLPWAVTFPWGSPPQVRQALDGSLDVWGLRLADLPGGGVMVERVAEGSIAAQAGFQPGDAIQSINQLPIERRGEAIEILISAGKYNEDLASKGQPPGKIDVELVGGEHRTFSPGPPLARSARIHPTQIYDAITGVLLAFFLWNYYPYRRRDGEVAALLITVYPITRFLLEAIRVDEPGQLGTEFSISQWISAVLLVGAAAAWFMLRARPRQLALGS